MLGFVVFIFSTSNFRFHSTFDFDLVTSYRVCIGIMTIDLWKGEFLPCSASDHTSFAYESTVKRWPTIITSIIDSLASLNGLNQVKTPEHVAKLAESKGIIRDLAGLIYEMRHDRDLADLESKFYQILIILFVVFSSRRKTLDLI